ncbi:hypothetical protein LLEC1_00572 [Akanthomyces lecanii]|uniref:Major facilitator superfamily (MFS) profile domain-containing protein n=1 Tax=Cordyceps confragosa TaxID=2714763 RepID=A0A179I2D9_CORDF|nr:hypothetical protein LLEC1_00572 [Akanthomyces lecanii]
MASSSTSDQLDLEKALAPPPPPPHSRNSATAIDAACLGSNEDKDCEGWAAGQNALAPACSRTNSNGRAAQDEGHNARRGDEDDGSHDHQHDHGIGGGGGVVGRVLSRITSKSSVDPGPPPDGGWLAWTQWLCPPVSLPHTHTRKHIHIHHAYTATDRGWANSFGTFQAYYTTLLDRSPSEISWIGSLNVFLLFFVGTFTGRLTDAGYFRAVFLFGSVLLAVGIFATAQCTTYTQFLLAQGVCIGVAHGCLFCPTLAVLSTYFHRNRALAVAVIAVANVGVRTRIRPRKTGPMVEWQAFKELEYTFYAAAAFFNFWGVYFAFFYVSAYSRDALKPPLSYPDSLNLLLILNGVGVIGRIVPNFIADRIGAVNVFIPTSIIASILVFCFIAIDSPAGLYAWVVVYGIIGAGIQSLFPAALSFLTTDLRKLGVRMGMVFAIVSFAVLTGPPIAGAIIASPAGYTGAKAFAGTAIAVGCGFLTAAKLARMRSKGLGWTSRI